MYRTEELSRNEKSIIDVLIERNNKNMILDIKVRSGPVIGSVHYLVLTKLRQTLEQNEHRNEVKSTKEIEYETINP